MEPQQPLLRKKYKYLVIGRMGQGKSSLCKYLTGVNSIECSGKIQACTKKCQLYKSVDKLNSQRDFQIQIIDTPGLDSKNDNIFDIVLDLLTILSNQQKINGILYVVSMTSIRDQTISWFLSFLTFLFSKKQLQNSIIPILTNYDKVLFQSKQKIEQNKKSRELTIQKIWLQKNIQKINFWKNNISWINDANQEQDLYYLRQFKEVYQNQLNILIQKTDKNQLKIKQNMDKFQEKIQKIIFQFIQSNQKDFNMIEQKINPFKIKVSFYQKSLKLLLVPISGWILFIGLFLSNVPISQKSELFLKKQNNNLQSQALKSTLDKIFQIQFLKELKERLLIQRINPFRQRLLGSEEKGFIQLKLLTNDVYDVQISLGLLKLYKIKSTKKSVIKIKQVQIKRLLPLQPQQIPFQAQFGKIILKVSENQNEQNQQLKSLIFKDKKLLNQPQRQYQFFNLIIKRPSDQYFSDLLKKMILNQFK